MTNHTRSFAGGNCPARAALALPAVLVAACLFGCGSPPVHVRTAAQPELRAVRTYAWYPDDGQVMGLYGSRAQLVREVMRKSIDDGLQRNGLRPAGETEADVMVVYQLGVRSRREATEFKTEQRNGETFAVPTEFTIYRGGTLLIYLINPRTNDAVWAGTASAEAKATDSDAEARSRLERAVRAVFDKMKKDKAT
jgi:hypothetical protein